MRRLVRYALYGLADLAALAILAAGAALIVIETPWFHNQVRERIVYEIEKATGGRVELGSFTFDWHTLSAEVRGLVLHGTEGAGEAPLFRADSIRVGLRIVSVFKKRVDLASVDVRAPRVNVIVYEDGRTNLPKPKVPRKSGRGMLDTILDLAIKRFSIADGAIQTQMRRIPLNALGENLRARVLYEPGPARYLSAITFRSLDVQAGGLKPVAIDVDVNLVLERNRLGLDSVRLAAAGATLDLRGAVTDFRSPRAGLDYTARLDLKSAVPDLGLGPILRRGSVSLSGRAGFETGSGYSVSGRLEAAGLAFRERGVFIENIRAASHFTAGPDRIELADLRVDALHGRFDGRAELRRFQDFRVDGDVRGFALHDATRVEGVHRMAWTGTVSGPLALTGEVRTGKPAELRLNTQLAIEPAPGDNPVRGSVDLAYDHARRAVSFGPSQISTRYSRIEFSGVLGREMRASVESTNIDDAQPAIAIFREGPPPEMPVRLLDGGVARFNGVVSGPVKNPVIRGHASATNFIATGREFDRGDADATVSRDGVVAEHAVLVKGGLHATGALRVAFRDWKPEPSGALAGAFTVRSPDLAGVLAAANLKSPVEAASGPVSADVKVAGTIDAPDVSGTVEAARVLFAGQPIDRVTGLVRYTKGTLDISRAQIDHGASHAEVSARFDHPAGTWSEGKLRFEAASRGIMLGQVNAVQERVKGLEGRLETQVAGELSIGRTGFRPGVLNGWLGLKDLALDRETLGSLQFTAATQGTHAAVRIAGDLAGAKIAGQSDWSLTGDYPVQGRVEFTPLEFSRLVTQLRPGPNAGPLPFRGSFSGALDFSGNTVDPASWKGTLRLPDFELRPAGDLEPGPGGPDLMLKNDGPLMVDIDPQGARVRSARFRGKNTDLALTGRIGFATRSPWDLRVQGGVNLALLRDFDRRVISSGGVTLDVSVRGPLARPDVYGRVDLRNASINRADFPNGIDNANGVVFLYRDRATIDSLTAETGGGKLSVSGFIGFGDVTTFHLQAKTSDVRVRYPEGVSSTSNADLTFTGTMDRSVLGGEVTITRVGFNPRSDLGTILANASQPIETPAQPSRFRQGMRFDVRIRTSPQVQFQTKLTKDVQAEASLRLRGDATHPVLLGRVVVNQGDVMFFGNKYSINSGQILFVNASKIEPTVNLDLETRARGINVTLHVSGPLNKLNVSYRSDPPLSFSEIVALLTTGREPTLTAGTAGAAQSQVGQNWQQAGAGALVSQAIASPITGRLQRFFGVSRLKIDPQVSGLTTNNAAARLTLEQNIASNLSFTYITDLSRAQAQTIRIEWDFTNNWSGVAEREENGQFGIDFLYRKQLK